MYPNVFVLDRSFVKSIASGWGGAKAESPVLDIWFDPCQRILFVLTETQIDRYNANGDYLDLFMAAPGGRSYKAICTFGAFLFIAYEETGCLFVASYAQNGSVIEKLRTG